MEFGMMPPMFGMGMMTSASEVFRLQQEAAEQALAQMQMQVQREVAQPPQAEEPRRAQREAPLPKGT